MIIAKVFVHPTAHTQFIRRSLSCGRKYEEEEEEVCSGRRAGGGRHDGVRGHQHDPPPLLPPHPPYHYRSRLSLVGGRPSEPPGWPEVFPGEECQASLSLSLSLSVSAAAVASAFKNTTGLQHGRLFQDAASSSDCPLNESCRGKNQKLDERQLSNVLYEDNSFADESWPTRFFLLATPMINSLSC